MNHLRRLFSKVFKCLNYNANKLWIFMLNRALIFKEGRKQNKNLLVTKIPENLNNIHTICLFYKK